MLVFARVEQYVTGRDELRELEMIVRLERPVYTSVHELPMLQE